MKFAIGFAVGVVVGRPVMSAVARKTRLYERTQKKTADVIYGLSYRIAEKMERVVFGNEIYEESNREKRYLRYKR